MKYYVIFSKVHGLKPMQARSFKHLALEWDTNTNGARYEWCGRYPARLHKEVKQMARLGWCGTFNDFSAALDKD